MNLSKRLAKRLLLVGLFSLCLVGLNGPYEKIAFGQNKLPDVNLHALREMASARAEVTSEWETRSLPALQRGHGGVEPNSMC